MCRPWGQKRAGRPSARALARWLHHENLREIGRLRRHHRLRPDRRRSLHARHFDVLLDMGPDIQPRAVICDKGYASKANREAARKRGIVPVIPHKANERDKPAFFARTLYKARSRIEQGVTAQALQTRAPPPMREDGPKLQINRRFRRRPVLDQIRPHSLVSNWIRKLEARRL